MSGLFGSSSQTIGYRYYLGMHMVLCHSDLDSLNAIYVDNKKIWESRQIANGTINISKEQIFGGDRSEGGVSGDIDVLFGRSDQGVNAYLNGQLGDIPNYRGVFSVVLKQMYLGMNPYLKKWSFRATRTTPFDSWYVEKAPIGGVISPDLPPPTGGRVAFIVDKSYSMTEYIYVPGYSTRKFIIGLNSLTQMLGHIKDLVNLGYPYDVAICFVNDYSRFDPGGGNTTWFNTSTVDIYENFDEADYDHIINDVIPPMIATKPDIYQPGSRPAQLIGIDGPAFRDESLYTTIPYDGKYYVYRNAESVARKTDLLEDFFPSEESRNNVLVSLGELTISTSYLNRPGQFYEDYKGRNSSVLTALGPVGKMLESGLVRYFGYAEKVIPIPWNTAKQSVVKFLPLALNTEKNEYTDAPYSTTYPFGQMGKEYPTISYDTGLSFPLYVNNPYVTVTVLDNTPARYTKAFTDFKELLKWDYPGEPGGEYDADMNPAHIIRECLTNPTWGMGYPADDIDNLSFTYAADVLWNESLGMSLLWDKEIIIEEFIKEILRHIDAVLFIDRRTGKFNLKLIRDDYDSELLIDLNESNILSLTDYSKPTLGELTNAVTVNSWDKATNTDASVTVQNSALFMLQGAEIGTKVQYPGITNKTNAIKLAQRDLRTLSTPLIKCTIEATDIVEGLNIGDCFTFSWSDYEIDELVMRVVGIAYGTDTKHRVRIQAVQDVFATPSAPIVMPEGPIWTDPTDVIASPVGNGLTIEAPYYELVQALGQVQVDDNLVANPELGLAMVTAVQPLSGIEGIVYVKDTYDNTYKSIGTTSFSQYSITNAELDYLDTIIEVSIDDEEADKIRFDEWAQVNKEIIVIVDKVKISDGVWELTIKRGCLDTQPAIHPINSSIYFVDSANFLYIKDYTYNEIAEFGIVTRSLSGETPAESSFLSNVQFKSRAAKPFPPQNVKINGLYYNNTLLSEMEITWAHRNRRQQTGSDILSFVDDSLALPEPGTSYTIRFYDNILLDFIEVASGITTNYYTVNIEDIPFELADVSIYIISTRDGFDCIYPYVQKLYLAPPIGGILEFIMDDTSTPPVGDEINIELG